MADERERRAVGGDAVAEVEGVTPTLRALARDRFAPGEGVHRLGAGEYVSEADWEAAWEGRPAWWSEAWALLANGRLAPAEVAAMTPAQVRAAYDEPGFEPGPRSTRRPAGTGSSEGR